MGTHRIPCACALTALVALAACHGGSSGGSSLIVTNLGLAGGSLQGEENLWLIQVSELGQGQHDLNGDGDTDDTVPFVYDFTDDSLTNLGLASASLPGAGAGSVRRKLVAFFVSEADQGDSDLNGDGDTDDAVLFVYGEVAGTTTSTGLAAAGVQPAIGLGTVAFAVAELAQGGQDLNGDGDTNDSVLHVYDSSTGGSTNAQRGVTGSIVFHIDFGFTTDEASAQADLNGDGDLADTTIFELFDPVLGGVVEVPLAIRGQPMALFGTDWFPLVDEGQQNLDLNGDGDEQDGVYHRIEPHFPFQWSLGLSSSGAFDSSTDGQDLALAVQEIDGLDRNGDGDLLDLILVVYDVGGDRTLDSGLAIDPDARFVFLGFPDRLFFAADESGQDADLNGDGDQGDDVLHLMDRETGAVTNLGLDVLALESGPGGLAFTRSESAANEDWNRDGDKNDTVEFYLDPFGPPTSTRIACAGAAPGSTFNSLLLIVPEGDEGKDLNGDDDLADFVFVLHDVQTATNQNLRLATTVFEVGMSPLERGLVLVSELAQGRDLNVDGDRNDSVLHRFARPGAGAGAGGTGP